MGESEAAPVLVPPKPKDVPPHQDSTTPSSHATSSVDHKKKSFVSDKPLANVSSKEKEISDAPTKKEDDPKQEGSLKDPAGGEDDATESNNSAAPPQPTVTDNRSSNEIIHSTKNLGQDESKMAGEDDATESNNSAFPPHPRVTENGSSNEIVHSTKNSEQDGSKIPSTVTSTTTSATSPSSDTASPKATSTTEPKTSDPKVAIPTISTTVSGSKSSSFTLSYETVSMAPKAEAPSPPTAQQEQKGGSLIANTVNTRHKSVRRQNSKASKFPPPPENCLPSKAVDPSKHVFLSSKIDAEDSLYTQAIAGWWQHYEQAGHNQKRMIAQQCIDDMHAKGVRFLVRCQHRFAGDDQYYWCVPPDSDKVSNKVVRALREEVVIQTSHLSPDEKAERQRMFKIGRLVRTLVRWLWVLLLFR